MKYLALQNITLFIWTAFFGLIHPANVMGQSIDDTPNAYPYDHIIRITALLTFDGTPVAVDELVACLAARGDNTSRTHLIPSRRRIAIETPDGGMIVLRNTSPFCKTRNAVFPGRPGALMVPEGWTPVITWYDNRDTRNVNMGIRYISETSLNAENGRLRIIQNFEIATPEHPFSNALLAEAEAQAVERDYCLGVSEGCEIFHPYPVMRPVPEKTWRNLDLDLYFGTVSWAQAIDPLPLIEFLEGFGEGVGIIAIPNENEPAEQNQIAPRDVRRLISVISFGRFPGLQKIFDWGIPISDTEQYSLFIGEYQAGIFKRRPLFLQTVDNVIPWKCKDGFLFPDFQNPGLAYLYSQSAGCHDRYVNTELMWPKHGIVGNFANSYRALFYDLESKTLWVVADVLSWP